MADSSDAASLVGRRLGRYEIVERIGIGPRLTVHRARLFGVEGFVRDVALKVPREEIAADERALDALLRGARRAVQLSHASMVQVVDVARSEAELGASGRPITYWVTELARGPSLERVRLELVKSSRRIPLGAILATVAEVARALDYVHRRQDDAGPLHHGSLHADQVFVTSEGQVKVGDACIFASRDPDPQKADLVALGAMLSGLAGAAAGTLPESVTALVEQLRRRQVTDAAAAHEALLELAFELAPSPDGRDVGVLARTLPEEGRSSPFQLATHVEASPLPPISAASDPATATAYLLLLNPADRADAMPIDGAPVPTSVLDVEMFAFGLDDNEGRDEKRAARVALGLAKKGGRGLYYLTAGPVKLQRDGAAQAAGPTDEIARRFAGWAQEPSMRGRVVADAALAPRLRGRFILEEGPFATSLVVAERNASATLGRFVGRGQELRSLSSAIERAVVDGPRTFVVRGPSGIGKSRLVHELARRVPKDLVRFVFADCGDTPAHGAFGVTALIVRGLIGASSDGPLDPRETIRALRAIGLDAAGVASACRTLGVSADAVCRPAATHEMLRRSLDAVAADKPLVVVIDHADHLDASSRSVIDAVLDREAGARSRILFLFVERAGVHEVAADEGLTVGELDDDAVAQLVASRMGARLLPPEIFELATSSAGGHPMLLEELVRELLDAALVRVRGGAAELTAQPSADLLSSARSGCDARVARVPEAALIALASVELYARDVSGEDVAAAMGSDVGAATTAIETIERLGLGRRDERGHLSAARPYAASAVGRIAERDRAAIHARIGEREHADALRCEEVGAGDRSALGDRHRRAADHLEAGGSLALAAGARVDAVVCYEAAGATELATDLLVSALADIGDPAQAARAVDALTRLSDHVELRRFDLAEGLGHALGLADSVWEDARRGAVRRTLARALAANGLGELAHVLCAQAAELASGDETDAVVETRLAIAAVLRDPDRAGDLLDLFERARERGASFSRPAHLDAAEVALLAGDVARAERWLGTVGPEDEGPRALRLDADLAAASGREPDAVRGYERALAVARDVQPLEAARAAMALARLSDGARAFTLFREAAEQSRIAGDGVIGELAAAELDLLEAGAAAAPRIRKQAARAMAQGRARDAETLEQIAAVAQER